MAGSKIKNTVQTEFVSKGAKGVEADTQRIGKAQTRLGQGSASAGRSFSAQANGLGGLVGVYAAAAANVFAISAAFAALNRAAQFETIITGTEQLAAAVGSSATIVVDRLKEVTQGQLSVVEAATQANLALSAGFNVDQIGELGEVANKASKALGRNLTDAFQRITRGAIKLEPELLDEIGIFTRIEPAVEAYARQLGKAVSQLTQFERRQAFVNQVIKDGQSAFQDVDVSGASTQKTFERLVANFTDLALVVGKFVADTLEPFAAFLDKNLGNRLILLGGIATIVFQRFGQAIGGFAVTAVGALGTKLEKLAEGFAKAGSSAKALVKQQAAIDFTGAGTFAGPRGAGSSVRQTIAAGPLTTAGALDIKEKAPIVMEAEKNLQKKINATKKEGEQLTAANNKRLQASVRRTDALNASLLLANNKLTTAGKGATALAKGLRLAGNAAVFLGNALGKAFKFLNFILIGFTTLQTVFSFFDIDIFETLRTLISGINKDAREAAKGMVVLANNTSLVEDKLVGLSEAQKKIAITQFSDSAGKSVGKLRGELKVLQRQLSELEKGWTFGQLFGFSSPEEVAADIAEVKAKVEGVKIALGDTDKVIQGSGSAISVLAALTKKSDETIAKSFDKGNKSIQLFGSTLVATLGNANIAIGTARDGIVTLNDEGLAKAGQGAAEASDKIKKLNEAIMAGDNLSAERASRDFGTITMLIEKAIKDAKGFPVVIAGLEKELKRVNEETGKLVGEFTTLDALSKKISKMFSGEFKFLDDRFLTGKVSAETGKVAVNEAEILKNRAQNFQSLKDQIAIEEGALIPNQLKINTLKDIESKLVKVSFASLLKQPPLQEKIRIAQEKALEALQDQVELQNMNNEALQNQIDRQTTLNALKDTAADKADSVKLAQAENDLAQSQADLAEKRLDSEIKLLQARQSNAKLSRDSALLDRQFTDAAATGAGTARVESARNQIAKMEERTLIRSERVAQLRIQVAKIERDVALESITRQTNQIKEDFENKRKDIEARREIVKLEAVQIVRKAANERAALEREEKIRKLQIDERKAGEAAQIQALKDRKTGAAEQRDIQNAQARNQKDQRDAQLNILLAQQMLLKEEIAFHNQVIRDKKGLLAEEAAKEAFTLSQDFRNIGTGIDGVSARQDKNIGLIRKQLTESGNILNSIINKNNLNFTKTKDNTDSEIARKEKSFEIAKKIDALNLQSYLNNLSGLQLTADKEIDIINQKLLGLDLEDEMVAKNVAIRLQALGIEEDKIRRIFELTKDKAQFEVSYQKTVNDAIISSASILKSQFVSGLMDLNKAFLDGTLNAKNFKEGLTNFLGDTVRKLQADFFQKTVAEPLSNFATDTLFGALGLTNEKGIDAVKLEAGNVPVVEKGNKGIVNSFANDAQSSLDGANKKTATLGNSFSAFLDFLVEKGRSAFSSIGKFLTDILSNISGSGGGGGIFSMFSNMFGGGGGGEILKGSIPTNLPPGIMGAASGGLIPHVRKMAAGGYAGGRDRVPALLEPGEFVMKRSAASNIGAGNLQAMNAGGMPNIKVQVKNEGTPQEATTATPRMDVDAIVIDIVTRDLRNNGPIRKSMRGGS